MSLGPNIVIDSLLHQEPGGNMPLPAEQAMEAYAGCLAYLELMKGVEKLITVDKIDVRVRRHGSHPFAIDVSAILRGPPGTETFHVSLYTEPLGRFSKTLYLETKLKAYEQGALLMQRGEMLRDAFELTKAKTAA